MALKEFKFWPLANLQRIEQHSSAGNTSYNICYNPGLGACTIAPA